MAAGAQSLSVGPRLNHRHSYDVFGSGARFAPPQEGYGAPTLWHDALSDEAGISCGAACTVGNPYFGMTRQAVPQKRPDEVEEVCMSKQSLLIMAALAVFLLNAPTYAAGIYEACEPNLFQQAEADGKKKKAEGEEEEEEPDCD